MPPAIQQHPPRARRRAAVFALLLALAAAAAAGCDTQLLPEAFGVHEPGFDGERVRFHDVTAVALPGPGTARRSTRARAIDVDGNGHLDIVIARQNGPLVLLLNDGHGHFFDASERIPATIQSGSDLIVADFDGDGCPDIVVVGENNASVALFLNDGHGRFFDASNRLPITGPATAVAAADVDDDGHVDLVIGRNGPLILLMNDGRGRFSDHTATRLPLSDDVVLALTFADLHLNRDFDDHHCGCDRDRHRHPDLVIGTSDTGTRLLRNNGRGFFRPATPQLPLPSTPEAVRAIVLGDVDGDGTTDLFLANAGLDGVGSNRLLRNEGHGRFTDITARVLPASLRSSTDAVFVDPEGDERLMLITTGDVIVALASDGRGVFRDATIATLPATLTGGGFGVLVADFDKDGRADLFLANGLLPDRLLLGR